MDEHAAAINGRTRVAQGPIECDAGLVVGYRSVRAQCHVAVYSEEVWFREPFDTTHSLCGEKTSGPTETTGVPVATAVG